MKLDVDEKQFKEWLETKGLKTRSMWEYLSHLRKFDFNNFDQEHINQYINENSNGFYNSVVRAFFGNIFLYVKRNTDYPEETKEFIGKLYIQEITGTKPEKKLRAITEKQVIEIAKIFDARNQMLLYISFYCGLRISELFGDPFNSYIKPLTAGHFNFIEWNKYSQEDKKEGILTVVGKGKKTRTIPVPFVLMNKIKEYGDNEGKDDLNDKLFDIKKSRWTQIINKASYRILGIKLHPHDLRASCLTYLFLKGKDIMEVRDIAGHDDIGTTQKYLILSKKIRKEYS